MEAHLYVNHSIDRDTLYREVSKLMLGSGKILLVSGLILEHTQLGLQGRDGEFIARVGHHIALTGTSAMVMSVATDVYRKVAQFFN